MGSKNIPISKYSKLRVGITIGDPSGVGPEITLKALTALNGMAQFIVIGDKWVLDRVRGLGPEARNVEFLDLNNVPRKNFSFGKIKMEYGKASMQYLQKAMELIKRRELDCLVTCPISKEAINKAGFNFSGHTEFLNSRTKTKDSVMMLLNESLKISLVTRHIPLSNLPYALKASDIYKVAVITLNYLKRFFLINRPKMAVCGINPHASDNGLLGKEENSIIMPAVKKLKQSGLKIEGPLPADIAMYKAKQKYYDAVIAMYHDQALIALKLTNPDNGVNITLGLPFVRTSPLHGTAFDISGKNIANPASLIAAIKLAIQCSLNQRKA